MSYSIWSEDDITFLKENYSTYSNKYLSDKMDKTEDSIMSKAGKLKLKKLLFWTEQEIEYLKNNYSILSNKSISKNLNKSISSISAKAIKLGIKKVERIWTLDQLNILYSEYPTTNADILSKKLNKNAKCIIQKACLLKLKKSNHWIDEDIKYLMDNYSDVSNKLLSVKLNRTTSSISHKARLLGLKKTQEYIMGYRKSPFIKVNYNHYTFDDLQKIALKFKTKYEFKIFDKTAYYKSRRMGIFKEICSHMINQKFSTPQLIMRYILDTLLNMKGSYDDRSIISPYEIDLYYHDYKLAFEYDGKNWHMDNSNDPIKENMCKKNGITLIRVKENDRNKQIINDVKSQIIENLHLINIATNLNISVIDVESIEIDSSDIFSSILDEDKIKEIISKYTFYKDFKRNEGSLYMKLKRKGILKLYTSELIRDINDKYKNTI